MRAVGVHMIMCLSGAAHRSERNFHKNLLFRLLELISEIGFDESYGARPLKRAIQDKVEDFISEEVLKGTVLDDVSYVLYVDNTEVKLKTVKKTKKKKGEN